MPAISVEDNGGRLVAVVSAAIPTATVMRVFVVDDAGVEHACYSGLDGHGRDVVTSDATVVSFVAPPLPVGGPYAVRLYVGGMLSKTIAAALTVENRNFASRSFSLKNLFAPRMKTGPRNVSLIPPLPVFPPSFGAIADQTTKNGIVFSFTPTVVNPFAVTVTFSVIAGTLPDGLALNPSTCEISGSATTVGTSSGLQLRVTWSDAYGSHHRDSPVFQIDVLLNHLAPVKPGYTIWLDPTDDASITLASGKVASIANKGSAGGTFAQVTAGQRVGLSMMNDVQALDFVHVDETNLVSSKTIADYFTDDTQFTIFFVFAHKQFTEPVGFEIANTQVILRPQTGGEPYGPILYYVHNPGQHGEQIVPYLYNVGAQSVPYTATDYLFHDNNDRSEQQVDEFSTTHKGSVAVYVFRVHVAGGQIWVNEHPKAEEVRGIDQIPAGAHALALVLGRYDGDGLALSGKLGDIIVYASALTDGEVVAEVQNQKRNWHIPRAHYNDVTVATGAAFASPAIVDFNTGSVPIVWSVPGGLPVGTTFNTGTGAFGGVMPNGAHAVDVIGTFIGVEDPGGSFQITANLTGT